ncbi:MAG: hypothetical protein ACHQUC_04655 [Chlamydiales bacterium]
MTKLFCQEKKASRQSESMESGQLHCKNYLIPSKMAEFDYIITYLKRFTYTNNSIEQDKQDRYAARLNWHGVRTRMLLPINQKRRDGELVAWA